MCLQHSRGANGYAAELTDVQRRTVSVHADKWQVRLAELKAHSGRDEAENTFIVEYGDNRVLYAW